MVDRRPKRNVVKSPIEKVLEQPQLMMHKHNQLLKWEMDRFWDTHRKFKDEKKKKLFDKLNPKL